MPSLFPLSIASGRAFCNRVIERKRVADNITSGTHTLLVSPRRYGKTSLVLQTIGELEICYAHIDLFLAANEEIVIQRMLHGIGRLISQITPKSVTAVRKLESLFKGIKFSLNLGKVGFEINLVPIEQSRSKTVWDIFQGLDDILKKYKRSAVIFIDEFQEIVDFDLCPEIEAALRFIAQKTENIRFIFSGNNRHLLGKIFDDKSKPLYKICDRILLNRISKGDYIKFLNRAAKTEWGKSLQNSVLDDIFYFTELHPYYINNLCARIWRSETLPVIDGVATCWRQLSAEESSSVANEIEQLSSKQRRLLQAIAATPNLTAPNSQQFIAKTGMSARGINLALATFKKYDFITVTTDGVISIVDPLLKYLLLKK